MAGLPVKGKKKPSLRDRIERRNKFRSKKTGKIVQMDGIATLQVAASAIVENAFEEVMANQDHPKSINEVTADMTDNLLAGDTDAVEEEEKRSTERAAEEVAEAPAAAVDDADDIEEPDEKEEAIIEQRCQSGISRQNIHNQAYQAARAFCMNEGVVNDSNDPEFNDDDPLDYVCALCFEDAATDAVSCFSQITGCKRWFHLNCLGLLDGGPEFEWVCMDCANHNLVLDKKCGIEGVELTDEILAAQPVDDSDEEKGGH